VLYDAAAPCRGSRPPAACVRPVLPSAGSGIVRVARSLGGFQPKADAER
jgi:hypothetical protein